MMPRHFEAAFPGRPEAISDARAFVRRSLAGCLPDALVDDAVLVASELATNAVRYSKSGQVGGKFTVIAEIGKDHLRVQIADQGGETMPLLLPPTRSGTGGRGLPIITALGVLRVDGDASGHTVSARLPLPQVSEGVSAE